VELEAAKASVGRGGLLSRRHNIAEATPPVRNRNKNKKPTIPVHIFFIFPPKDLLCIVCTINIFSTDRGCHSLTMEEAILFYVLSLHNIVSGQGLPCWLITYHYETGLGQRLFYNDARAGTDVLTLFITFKIYVMNVLAFLTSICFHHYLLFSSNKSFCHSRIWHHLTSSCVIFWHLRSAPILIANRIVMNKGISTHRSSLCAQLYSTRAIRRALDIVWIPTK